MSCDNPPDFDVDAVTGVVRVRLSAEAILEFEIGVAGADVQVQVPVPKPKARLISWQRQEFGKHVIDIRVRHVDLG